MASVEIRVTSATVINLGLVFVPNLPNKVYMSIVIDRNAIPNGKDPCRFAQSIITKGMHQIIFEFEE